MHYPVPESLASLAWGQAGRLLSAIFLGMFRWPSFLYFSFGTFRWRPPFELIDKFTPSLEEAGHFGVQGWGLGPSGPRLRRRASEVSPP